jgi:hypothetical protein
MSDPAAWYALNKLLDDFADDERCQRGLIDAFCELHNISPMKVHRVVRRYCRRYG